MFNKRRIFGQGLMFLLLAYLPLQAAVEPVEKPIHNAMPTYTDESLAEIAFPIGGLGTGNIILDGRGSIRNLEIFNKPDRSGNPPDMTCFALWVKKAGETPVTKILEKKSDASDSRLRFEKSTFKGEFPFAEVALVDALVPVSVTLEAYNPFVPLDVKGSGFPIAIFNWQLKNTSDKNVQGAIAFNMGNPIKVKNDEGVPVYGENENSVLPVPKFQGILMTSKRTGLGKPDYANVVIGTTEDAVLHTQWGQSDPAKTMEAFWKDFSDDGDIASNGDTEPTAEGQTEMATVTVKFSLAPGEKTTVPFYLFWYAPNRWVEPANEKMKNYYGKEYEDITEVVKKFLKQKDELAELTQDFRTVLYSSTLPSPVMQALSSNLALLKSYSLMLQRNGDAYACSQTGIENKTYEWNYAQALAFLFPSLERDIRSHFLGDLTFDNGYQIPKATLFDEQNYQGAPSADGQLSNVLLVYRDWKLSGKDKWIKDYWADIKRSLAFAWTGVGNVSETDAWQKTGCPVPWDVNKDGVIEGPQTNAFGATFYGPEMTVGSVYLAALRAASQMGLAVGDLITANEYMAIYKLGQQRYEQFCWNGSYYDQEIYVPKELSLPDSLLAPADDEGNRLPVNQVGSGCLSTQLLGQFLAHISGLGYILNEQHVDRAMYSIYKNNYKGNVTDDASNQALVTCSWPNGQTPAMDFSEADQSVTGIEYMVATSMVYSGLIQEGVDMVKAIQNRYQGYNGNPWGKTESGIEDIRNLASWALLPALSGFEYDASERTMGFRPRISHFDFNTFWSCGRGWGQFHIRKDQFELSIKDGNIKLERLNIRGPQEINEITSAEKNGEKVDVMVVGSEGSYRLLFDGSLTLKSGDTFIVIFK